jgi:hypothetical protein
MPYDAVIMEKNVTLCQNGLVEQENYQNLVLDTRTIYPFMLRKPQMIKL